MEWNENMSVEDIRLVKKHAEKVHSKLVDIEIGDGEMTEEVRLACAWEQLCQNMGIRGFEFS